MPIRFSPRPIALFWVALSISLIASASAYFLFTWHWPLVSDASVMHYLAFLTERGWVPYRQIVDQQFPGALLLELINMHIFGMDSLGWRLYDFTLMACATAAFFAITRGSVPVPDETGRHARVWITWLPGLFAACLFILIHGRDGLAQGGQRDLTIAVQLILATAFLFSAIGRDRLWGSVIFGLFSGLACSIKPIVLPIGVAQLVFACYVVRRRRGRWLAHAVAAALGWTVAPALALVFLLREHAVGAFIAGFRGMLPYYANLGHRSPVYILVHSVSPVLFMVALWLALLVVNNLRARPRFGLREWAQHWATDWQRTTLLLGVIFAVVDCILQARALPYYRYPLLAFLLPLMAIDFCRAVVGHGARSPHAAGLARCCSLGLGLTALSFGGFWIAPQSAVLIHRYRWWDTPFLTSLQQNLDALGGSKLSKHIQCIDSIAGCGTVFYRLRLEPVSGVLGDYVLFGSETLPLVQQERRQFEQDIATNPPQVIVVASGLFMGNADGFTKLDRWTALKTLLATRYRMAVQWSPGSHTVRWWSREELPASYRVYVLRGSAADAANDTAGP